MQSPRPETYYKLLNITGHPHIFTGISAVRSASLPKENLDPLRKFPGIWAQMRLRPSLRGDLKHIGARYANSLESSHICGCDHPTGGRRAMHAAPVARCVSRDACRATHAARLSRDTCRTTVARHMSRDCRAAHVARHMSRDTCCAKALTLNKETHPKETHPKETHPKETHPKPETKNPASYGAPYGAPYDASHDAPHGAPHGAPYRAVRVYPEKVWTCCENSLEFSPKCACGHHCGMVSST